MFDRLGRVILVIITFDQSLTRQFRPSPIPMSQINVTTPINASVSRLSGVTGFVYTVCGRLYSFTSS